MVEEVFNNAIDCLSDEDKKLPQVSFKFSKQSVDANIICSLRIFIVFLFISLILLMVILLLYFTVILLLQKYFTIYTEIILVYVSLKNEAQTFHEKFSFHCFSPVCL